MGLVTILGNAVIFEYPKPSTYLANIYKSPIQAVRFVQFMPRGWVGLFILEVTPNGDAVTDQQLTKTSLDALKISLNGDYLLQ